MNKMSSELLFLKEKTEKLLESKPQGARTQWPKEIKTSVLNSLKKGISKKQLSKKTGISYAVICRWAYKKRKEKDKGSFKQLAFMDQNPLIILSKRGFEIQGLSFEEIQIILKKGLL